MGAIDGIVKGLVRASPSGRSSLMELSRALRGLLHRVDLYAPLFEVQKQGVHSRQLEDKTDVLSYSSM